MDNFPVLEVFVCRHWEPWCVFFQPTGENIQQAMNDAKWKIQPLRFREGCTNDWGGLEGCLIRMSKVFCHNLN